MPLHLVPSLLPARSSGARGPWMSISGAHSRGPAWDSDRLPGGTDVQKTSSRPSGLPAGRRISRTSACSVARPAPELFANAAELNAPAPQRTTSSSPLATAFIRSCGGLPAGTIGAPRDPAFSASALAARSGLYPDGGRPIFRHSGDRCRMGEPARVGKRGAVVIPALRLPWIRDVACARRRPSSSPSSARRPRARSG